MALLPLFFCFCFCFSFFFSFFPSIFLPRFVPVPVFLLVHYARLCSAGHIYLAWIIFPGLVSQTHYVCPSTICFLFHFINEVGWMKRACVFSPADDLFMPPPPLAVMNAPPYVGPIYISYRSHKQLREVVCR